ncbi:galanin receptor 2b-like [Montipora foliosa]|uniref:galanin receptor 2b-like n=1 Tax=Montipora foliosa TaxID=591990 RepID=UPI0035F1A660
MEVKEAQSQGKRFNNELITYHKTLYNISLVFLALGIVENILVCLVLWKASKTSKRERLELGTVECKIVIFSSFTCAAITFILLAGIAADRYIHIIFPIRTFGVKPKKYLIMVLIWICAMAICSGFIFSATVSKKPPPHGKHPMENACPNSMCNNNTRHPMDYREPPQHCIPGTSRDSTREIPFTIYFSLAFLVPLCVIVFSYTKIISSLQQKTKASDLGNRSTARAQLRTIKIFIIVVLSFLFSWAPIMILDMIESYRKKEGTISIGVFPVRPLFDCITQTSSIFNPLIYALGDANFRKSLRLLFHVGERSNVNNRVSPVAERTIEANCDIHITELTKFQGL